MRLLEDFRAILAGFISGLLLLIYAEYQKTIMGMTIIFIIFSSWLMLVIWNQKKQLSAKFPLSDWLIGSDLMKYYDISHNQLSQYVYKGLKVYPSGDEVPPLTEEELGFKMAYKDYSDFYFKKQDIEKLLRGLQNK
jgi:hypothetical protein